MSQQQATTSTPNAADKSEFSTASTTATSTTTSSKTANHVYILHPQHSWIPAQIVERQRPPCTQSNSNSSNSNNNNSNNNDVMAVVVVSIPEYAEEQAIVCDGGRTALSWKRETITISTSSSATAATTAATLAQQQQSQYQYNSLPLQNVDTEGRLQVVEDMVDLPFLHEAAILYNLKARHVQNLPYTRTGDIIIAVNPYQWFHELYSISKRLWYDQALVWNPIGGSSSGNGSGTIEDPRIHLPPHVYETSCLSYKGLLKDGQDQSILVSGESGAGKTETVKILLSDLASVQMGPNHHHQQQQQQQQQHHHHHHNDDDSNEIVRRVLDSNPLLEAFGNAQTLRNDNSSRFGKYLQLQFHRSSESKCLLAGSKCEVYLLEKSRVTMHHPEERTYHIFYQLLAAPESTKQEIWSKGLANTDQESFDYVGFTSTTTIEGLSDAERFHRTVQALELIGVHGETLLTLWRAICIVLQLGNIDFLPAPNDADASIIADLEELDLLADIMGISQDQLTTALTIRTVQARSETFKVPLTAVHAKESTDAFAKEIYAKTFLWLVRTINEATCAEKNYVISNNTNISPQGKRRSSPTKASASAPHPQRYGIIGLLDIFGFETFETNRFEQLCINYANEKLQQKFTQDVFQSVQVEYEMEGIELEEITYDDNTNVLDLVEGKMGLLACLNEECLRPKGSDKTFVSKSQAMNKDNPCFFRDRHAPEYEFGIRHFAGSVIYNATNFVVKNKDTLPTDLQYCASFSSNAIVAKELSKESDDVVAMDPSTASTTTTNNNNNSTTNTAKKRRPKTSTATAASTSTESHHHPVLRKRTSNLVAETVWTKFKNQLSRLMDTLSRTKTRYIRCIKPNTQKRARVMEHASTVEQLRCAGVVAAVTISRSAFPNRLEHLIVLERFKALWPQGGHFQILQDVTMDLKQRTAKATQELLTLALKDMEFEKKGTVMRAFVMGHTRAYFRAGALEFLEGERIKHLGNFASKIQNQVRGFVARTKYQTFRNAVVILQAGFRRRVRMQKYQIHRRCAVRVQCWYRVIYAKSAMVHLRRKVKATKIQTRWRIQRDQSKFRKWRSAACVVQARMRGIVQRKRYKQSLIDKKEEAKLENQLRALQQKLEEAETKRLEAEKKAESKARAAIEKYKEDEAKQKELANETSPSKREVEREQVQSEQGSATAHERAHLQEEQQNLMDESGRMLEFLRKEVFKLRGQNQQLKSDFDLLKDNNQRLMDANASAGASFASLNQHAKQLSKQNAQLQSELNSYKVQVQKMNMLQVELKDELKMKQASYIAEVQSRLETQKALQTIIDMIQDKCRDHRLVERILEVADKCDMEHMAMGGGTVSSENESPKHESKSKIFGYLNFFSG